VPVPEVMKVYEVVREVMKAMKVSKASEAVSWEVRAMTERVHAPRSAGHAHAVHAAHAAHRLGGNVAGTASIATTTAHPIVILRSMTILHIVTPRHSESAMRDVQMTKNLFSD
jgi:hypothetical protein